MTALDYLKEAERIVLDYKPDENASLQSLHDAKLAIWRAMEALPEGV